jgi:hypothetical protein
MGSLQTVLTAVCGHLGSPSRVGATSKITQSMCRMMTEQGREHSGSSG